MREKLKSLQRDAQEAAEFLREKLEEGESVKIISHVDADGISAAAILARCLHYYNVPYVVKFCKPMRSDEIEKLSRESCGVFIFVDQGTTQLEDIHKHLLAKGKTVLLIDHHAGELKTHSNLRCVHSHTVGINGGRDISASGVAYLVAENMGAKFKSLIRLALVGAIGDRQEFVDGFQGANAIFLKQAVDFGMVEIKEGLKLAGRSLRSVLFSLWLSTRPYLPGLSGDIDESRKLLENLDIDPSVSICELDEESEKTLRDAIIAKTNIGEDLGHLIWGKIYIDKQKELVGTNDLRDFAYLLDSCADMNSADVGFAVAIGDKGMLNTALDRFETRQKEMLKILQQIMKKMESFKEMKNFRYIFCPEIGPLMIGEAISLLLESAILREDKPAAGISVINENELKISVRATLGLADAGYNVGEAVRKAASEVGENGGGHDVAASARVRKEKLDDFLRALDRYLGGGA
ncbi:MAG: DHH family phosphoesterase [Candidatus Hadarchaeales archaeon]